MDESEGNGPGAAQPAGGHSSSGIQPSGPRSPPPDLSALVPGRVREPNVWFSKSSPLLLPVGVASAIGVFFLLGALGVYNIPFIIKTLPQGFGPCEISLEFTTYTFLLGFAGAVGLGLVRAYPPRRDPNASKRRLKTRFSWVWRW